MKSAPILASLPLTGLAPAATVMMRFETIMDTTGYGGTADTPLVVTYSFDSALAPGSGPSGPGVGWVNYGPLSSIEIQLGSQTISGTAGSGITVFNDTADGDAYDVRIRFPAGTIFGKDVDFFRFMVVDPSGAMFDDDSLPTSFNFSATAGFYQQAEIDLDDPFNPNPIPLSVNEAAFMPVGERTPFTLTVVPEPGPLAIFGVAVLGSVWIRRRGRR